MKTIVMANHKGGASKTTTTLALATSLHLRGFRVLIIDLDPQSTAGIASRANIAVNANTLTVLLRHCSLAEAIQHCEHYDICPAPAHDDLEQAAFSLVNTPGKELRLREAIASLPDNAYDFVLLDTGKGLGLLHIIALTAADYLIIPSVAEAYSTIGVMQLLEDFEPIRQYYNQSLCVLGVLVTKYSKQWSVCQKCTEAAEELAGMYHIPTFKTKIRRCAAVVNAQYDQVDIITGMPLSKNKAAQDYITFTDEMLTALGEQ